MLQHKMADHAAFMAQSSFANNVIHKSLGETYLHVSFSSRCLLYTRLPPHFSMLTLPDSR